MADTKISALPDGGALLPTDQVPVNRAGTTTRVLVTLLQSLAETTVVATGVTTQNTTMVIPAGSIVFAVPTRVTVQPGGTTTYQVGDAIPTSNKFNAGASVSTVATTTDRGSAMGPVYYEEATPIQFVFDTATTNALGRISTVIWYYQATPPTS